VDAVVRDVRDGAVSVEAAEKHYGVVIHAGRHAVDTDATALLRDANRGAAEQQLA
jgi:hypothetical protein